MIGDASIFCQELDRKASIIVGTYAKLFWARTWTWSRRPHWSESQFVCKVPQVALMYNIPKVDTLFSSRNKAFLGLNHGEPGPNKHLESN